MEVMHSRGDITHAGQILNPLIAQAFGQAILGHHAQVMRREGEPIGTSRSYSPQICRGLLGESLGRFDLLDEIGLGRAAESTFKELLAEQGEDVLSLAFSGDYFVGTPGFGVWHIDGNDYRLLVNLGTLPIELEVADRWVWTERFPGANQPQALESSTIRYVTGEGIFLNNKKSPTERQPHAGRDRASKVFMRLRAYAQRGSNS